MKELLRRSEENTGLNLDLGVLHQSVRELTESWRAMAAGDLQRAALVRSQEASIGEGGRS
jgi:hypothetical protein